VPASLSDGSWIEFLRTTAVNVDDFFRHIVDLIAHQKITQQRLNGLGFVTARERVQDNYLILSSRQ
jgi:hypothetical protein